MSNNAPLTPAALWRAYVRSDKAQEELHGNWVMAVLYRAPGVVISAICLRLGIGAGAVTLTGGAAALSLPVAALILPPVVAAWTVCLLAIIAVTLDCVDGDVARATNTTSVLGARLDFLVDMAFWGLLYLAIGILADRLHAGGWGWSVIALFAGWMRLLARLFNDYAGGAETTSVQPWTMASIGAAFLAGLSGAIPFLALAVIGAPWVILLLVAYSLVDLIDACLRMVRVNDL